MKTLLHAINAIGFLAIGVYFLFWVESGAQSLGIGFQKAQGLTDFRATYGGMCLGIGAFFAFAVFAPAVRPAAGWLGIFLYAGLGLTRAVGMVTDGSAGQLLYTLLALEIILFVGCLVSILR